MSITGLLKIIDILYLILGLVVFLLYRDFLIYLVLVGGVYFLLSALYKAYSIGFDTLRGNSGLYSVDSACWVLDSFFIRISCPPQEDFFSSLLFCLCCLELSNRVSNSGV